LSEQTFYVYGLFEPTDGPIDDCFYIGKGTGYRISWHFQKSVVENRDTPKSQKVKQIKQSGREPYGEKLYAGIEDESKAFELEKFLIEEIGLSNLMNVMPGGRQPEFNEEFRQQLSDSLSGRELSEEHKRKIAESRKGEDSWVKREEVREKIAETLTGRTLPESHRQSISEGNMGREVTEETREKIREANCGEGGPNTKLSSEQVVEIKWLFSNTYLKDGEIADVYPVSWSAISAIRNGQSWAHLQNKERPSEKIRKLGLTESESPCKYDLVSPGGRSSQLRSQERKEIMWLLQNTDYSQREIGEFYSVDPSCISYLKLDQSTPDETVEPSFIDRI
jgi:hypothetical protein